MSDAVRTRLYWPLLVLVIICVYNIYDETKDFRRVMVSLSSVSSFFPFSSSNHEHDLDDLFTTDATTNTNTKPTTTPITTTTTTTRRNSVCDVFLGTSNNSNSNTNPSAASSSSFVWQSLRHRILQASYFPEEAAQLPAFRTWVEDLLEFHTTSRLRKTRTHPADPTTVGKLLHIVQNRLDSLLAAEEAAAAAEGREGKEEDNSSGSSTLLSEPLHILVMGGSVTQGINCEANPVGLPAGHWTRVNARCAWPMRLEYLFNHVFFGGAAVVHITNMGAGGSSSEIGSLVMDYQLFPHHSLPIPHIIISSYAANDAQQPDVEGHFWYEEVPHFIQAAKNVRPCEEHLPLVVLADHVYGYDDVTVIHKLSGYYALLASWYDLMAFNQQNIGRHELLYHFHNATAIAHLMGSEYDLHMGMGFHIGMAWTALFNFLDAIVDTCTDVTMTTRTRTTTQQEQEQGPDKGVDEIRVTRKNPTPHNSKSRIEAVLPMPSLKHLPKLPKKLDRTPLTLPKEAREITSLLVDHWNNNDQAAQDRCVALRTTMSTTTKTRSKSQSKDSTTTTQQQQQQQATVHVDDDVLDSSSSSLILCSYAWMVGKGTGINTVQELQRVLAPVWVVTTNSSTSTTTDESSGWKVTGYPVRTPRTGWYAHTANATFELRVPILVPTHTLTIVSMKSYGPTWIGSKLAVTVTIQRASSSSSENNNNNINSTTTNGTTTIITSPLDDLDNHDTTATYEIDGFHDIQTSVHFPHKFPLPGKDGAAVGDEVIVRARLVGGSTFKINGLALCRF